MKLLVILFLVSVMFSCGNQDISKEHLSKDVGYLYYRKDVYIGNCHYAIISAMIYLDVPNNCFNFVKQS